MLSVEWCGEQFVLLPERAVHWPAADALVVADVHLGKPEAFRAAGIPVPAAVTGATLDRLGRALDRVRPGRLLVLGDLLHARAGRTPGLDAAFTAWRAAHRSLDILLVRGNHDVGAGDPPASWRIDCADEPCAESSLELCHHPDAAGARPCLAGHVHPAIVLGAADGFRARRPCFHLSSSCFLLPALGAFTGAHSIRPEAGDRVFVPDESDVLDVSALVARRAATRR
jgi:DNA ligase-associated metallophosphoesterase